jgi:hypothetical protein
MHSRRKRSYSKKSSKTSLKGRKSRKLKLVSIKKSPIKGKKLRATFSDGTHTDFGAKNYSDYTLHKNYSRMIRYKNRHKSRENWNKPKTAGALSRWVLWNKPSLRESIKDYKKRFNL